MMKMSVWNISGAVLTAESSTTRKTTSLSVLLSTTNPTFRNVHNNKRYMVILDKTIKETYSVDVAAFNSHNIHSTITVILDETIKETYSVDVTASNSHNIHNTVTVILDKTIKEHTQ